MANPVIPSSDAWTRVSEAVKRVESGQYSQQQANRDPYYVYPCCVFKKTGEADVNGVMPGKILFLNSDTLTWEELEDCYILMADTI